MGSPRGDVQSNVELITSGRSGGLSGRPKERWTGGFTSPETAVSFRLYSILEDTYEAALPRVYSRPTVCRETPCAMTCFCVKIGSQIRTEVIEVIGVALHIAVITCSLKAFEWRRSERFLVLGRILSDGKERASYCCTPKHTEPSIASE